VSLMAPRNRTERTKLRNARHGTDVLAKGVEDDMTLLISEGSDASPMTPLVM